MTASAFLGAFSPQQREVVQAGEGPLSILAGPGSGKTTALARRIAYLVEERGVSPSSVLAITFTTAAAATLGQRLAGVLGERAAAVDIATFHALGLRIVRQWSAELGFGLYPRRSMAATTLYASATASDSPPRRWASCSAGHRVGCARTPRRRDCRSRSPES
jgi:superfamily I DNA/RNA helicase